MIDFKYRPDVDGLRAVAVTLVILFHAGLGFSGGFVGVDVFFVISGFLITGLILKEQDGGKFSLANFWVRRVRRIVPAATVMVVAVLIAGFLFLLPSDYMDLGKSTIAQQLMASNVYFWKNTGYFDGPSDLKPLLHTWSLAVEEQFYLGYPLLLMFLHRVGRKLTFATLVALCFGSLAVSQYGVREYPSATFFLLPTRAWELLIGGLICFLPKPTKVPQWALSGGSWLSLAAILSAGLAYTSTTTFPGFTALVPTVATAILIYANSYRLSLPAAVLSSRPLVLVGLMSYSLYLWHWPILAFLRYRFGEVLEIPIAVLAIVSAFIFSAISWGFIERPFRQGSRISRPRNTFTFAILTATVLLSLSGLALLDSGGRYRFSDSYLAIINTPYAGKDWGATGNVNDGFTLEAIGDRSPSTAIKFILWGDSYGKCLAGLIDELAKRHYVKGLDAGLGGTPPLLHAWTGTENQAKATTSQQEVISSLSANQIEWVILFAAWDIHINGMSKLRSEDSTESYTAFVNGFENTVRILEQKNVKILLVLQPPYQWQDMPSKVARSFMAGNTSMVFGVDQDRHRSYQQNSLDLFRSFENRIELIDVDSRCFDSASGHSIVGNGPVPFYSDAGHPSKDGIDFFYRAAMEEFFAREFGNSMEAQTPTTSTSGNTQSTEADSE